MPITKELEIVQNQIVEYVRAHSELDYFTISDNLNITRPMLVYYLKKAGYRRNRLLNRVNFAVLASN